MAVATQYGRLRLGQRNRFSYLPYPSCPCGKPATVSKSLGGKVDHKCLECMAAPVDATAELLRSLGLA
jgi:hypothetical protein